MSLGERTNDKRRTLALVAVATLTVFASMAIAPALPAMAKAFPDTPNADLLAKLSITLPALAIVLAAPVAGWIADRYGRLPLLLGSMALFGLAGASGYFLDDLYAILASRMVLGLAIGGSMTTVQTLAGDYFHGEARARFAALQSAVMSMGAMIIVGAAGILAEFDWRAPFLLYLHAWLLIPLAMWLLDEPSHATRRRGADDQAVLDRGRLLAAYGFAWFGAVMFYMVASQLPFLLAERGYASGLRVGLVVALVQLFSAIGAAFHVRLRARLGFLPVFAIAFGLMGTGYAILAGIGAFSAALLGASIAGLGVGLFFPNCSLWVLSIAPPAVRGRAAGGLSAALHLGQFSSPLVLQWSVAAAGIGGAFGTAAGLLFLVAGAAVAVRMRHGHP